VDCGRLWSCRSGTVYVSGDVHLDPRPRFRHTFVSARHPLQPVCQYVQSRCWLCDLDRPMPFMLSAITEVAFRVSLEASDAD
jgi:hypothetical protein